MNLLHKLLAGAMASGLFVATAVHAQSGGRDTRAGDRWHTRSSHAADWCGPRGATWLALGLTHAELSLDLDAARRPLWEALKTAIGEAYGDLAAACPAGVPGDPASAEAWLEAGLAAVRRVKEPYAAFVATLDEKRAAVLADLIAHRGRR